LAWLSQSAGRAMGGCSRAEAAGGVLKPGLCDELASSAPELRRHHLGDGGNQRLAIMSTAVLFIAGLLLLLPVNVLRGREAALQADAAAAQR
jgi:hypothetical protein